MSNDPVSLHFQAIRQYIARAQQEGVNSWADIEAVLEDLHVIYEEIQTNLEAAMLVEQQLLQQNQHFYNLFQTAPVAYLVIDPDGIILEANEAIAQLLNVSQTFLVGKSFSLYIVESERSSFYTKLTQLTQTHETQVWRVNLSPKKGEPISAHLQVAIHCDSTESIEYLKIGVFNLSQAEQVASPVELSDGWEDAIAAQQPDHSLAATTPGSSLSHSLDGLRVLVVDDEAGICKFITALLEFHGIEVRAVTSSAAALEEIEHFQPDVLLSDIRLPGGDGYELIRRVRALETKQGKHLPAAAITAYLDEDREKALNAGYEGYWYKLSQPTELVEVVVQLAEQITKR